MSTTERDPKFKKANGELTMYAFACGYVQAYTEDGTEYYGTSRDGTALYKEGAVWSVRIRVDGVAYWHTFDTYTEAREAWGKARAYIKSKVALYTFLNEEAGADI